MVDSRFIKSISQRFDIETARHPNKLRRLRWRITCSCGLLTLLIILGNLAFSGDAIFQSRPVTFSHASLANNCKQCHDASFQLPRRLLGSTAALFIHSCEQCHEQSLADHHGAPSDSSSITDCASCHSEHRGQTSLTNVSDSQCVTCHSDINANTDHHQSTFANSVNSIDSHPEITLLKHWINSQPARTHGVHQAATLAGNENGKFVDASNIKFNHAVHLNQNGVLVPPDHPEYGRFWRASGSSTTTLDCASCHPPDAIGQGMQPINYEQHCASCHQLSYSSLLARTPLANNKPLPHVDPELINGILRDRLIIIARCKKTHRPRTQTTETTSARLAILPKFLCRRIRNRTGIGLKHICQTCKRYCLPVARRQDKEICKMAVHYATPSIATRPPIGTILLSTGASGIPI